MQPCAHDGCTIPLCEPTAALLHLRSWSRRRATSSRAARAAASPGLAGASERAAADRHVCTCNLEAPASNATAPVLRCTRRATAVMARQPPLRRIGSRKASRTERGWQDVLERTTGRLRRRCGMRLLQAQHAQQLSRRVKGSSLRSHVLLLRGRCRSALPRIPHRAPHKELCQPRALVQRGGRQRSVHFQKARGKWQQHAVHARCVRPGRMVQLVRRGALVDGASWALRVRHVLRAARCTVQHAHHETLPVQLRDWRQRGRVGRSGGGRPLRWACLPRDATHVADAVKRVGADAQAQRDEVRVQRSGRVDLEPRAARRVVSDSAVMRRCSPQPACMAHGTHGRRRV